jgi:phage baseplate assembly protein V
MRIPDPTLAETLRRLDNLIRLGTVAQVDHAGALCRVQSGGLLSGWLPWLTRRAGDTRTWCPPTVDEQVIVLNPTGELGAGIVLSGIYTQANDQPSASADEHVVDYPDGARIAYDHASGALTVSGMQSIAIDCPDITINGQVVQAGGLLSSNGIVLHTHTHVGVQPGGGSTGMPQ